MNIRRILLLVPPVTRPADYGAEKMRVSPFFPLGLAYLAAVLRDRYEVRVIDCLLEGIERGQQDYSEAINIPGWLPDNWDVVHDPWPADREVFRYGLFDGEIQRRIEDYQPDVVGISCLFASQEWDARNLCRIAKRANRWIITALGGPHAGANHRELITAESALNYIIIGEGEESFPALLGMIEGKGGLVDGVAFRMQWTGEMGACQKTSYISDLDTIPFPAWDMLDMPAYLRLMLPHDRCRQRPFMPVSTSRGCPHHCGFCAIRGHWGTQQRFRSADNVLGEIDYLVGHYGVREIHFEDDNLTADRQRALAIFYGLQDYRFRSGPNGPVVWAAPSGLAMRNLDGELLDAMAASGCYSVSLAIESGNQGILKLMHKPVNLKRVPGLVRDIQSRGMLAKGFFILGYPGETKDTIRQTVEFVKSLCLDWAFFFIASPLPHTEMWEQAKAAGMLAEGEFNPLTSMHEPVLRLPGVEPEWLAQTREQAIRDICFTDNPNIERNPAQAIADFEHVLSLYPHFDFAREALERAWAAKIDREVPHP